MSTLDPDNDDIAPANAPGHDVDSLGPGDSSDTGSDTRGAKRHDFDRDSELDNHALEEGVDEAMSDTDRGGTGERASADGDGSLEPDSDVLPDRIDNIVVGDNFDDLDLPDDDDTAPEDESLRR